MVGPLGGDERVAEQGRDERLVRRIFDRLAKRFERFGRPARFEQDLALELEEIGIVRSFGEQALRLGQSLLLLSG
jgi:hypothetical protein